MEMLDQSHTGADEDPAKNERSDDTPEQNAVLLFVGNGEVLKNYEKDKQVVDTERQFKNVSGNELESDLLSVPEIKHDRKCARQSYVEGAPSKGRAKAYSTLPPMEDKQVEDQHADGEGVEEDPEVEQMRFPGIANC